MSITILLVDDDELKRDIIRDRLLEISSDLRLSFASNLKGAKQLLRATQFDLLIIDLVIPLSDIATVPSRTGGLLLLEWLEDWDTKPGYVVGLSSFSDVAEEQAAEFADRSWYVLKYDPSTSTWFEQLRALIHHIQGARRQAEEKAYQADVLVVTALRTPELAAILDLGWNFEPILQPVQGRQFVRTGHKELSNGQRISVLAGTTSKMGMVWTSLFVSNAIKQLRPRVVAMTGICMGHPIESRIGDIVVAVHSWNWQAGKLSTSLDGSPVFQNQPEPVVASKALINLWDDMAADSAVLEKIHREYCEAKPAHAPKLKIAPMVSGSLVIAHESVHSDIFEQDRKIRAVDMETFGVYAACESIEDLAPLFFSVKCISDLGTSDKEDKFQKYCAYVSARALDLFLERYWGTVIQTIHES